MISVMKNDWQQTKNNFAGIGIMLALTFGVIVVSFLMAGRTSDFATIAVLEKDSEKINNSELKIFYVKEKPKYSELVKGTYDAFVQQQGENHFIIETTRSSDFQKKLISILETQKSKHKDGNKKENAGILLLSYLVVFILITSLTNMKWFSEEKEKRIFERVVTTPTSYFKVLLGHYLFSFFIVFISTLVFIIFINLLFKKDLGISYVQLGYLLLLICAFSTGFALFIAAIFKEGDKANMFGSLTIIITTMLSGSFISFEGGNRWLSRTIQYMPQKRFLLLTKDIEAKQSIQTLLPNIIYLSFYILLFFILATCITKKKYQLK